MRLDPSVAEPPTLAFGQKIAQRRQAGHSVLSLGIGEPDIDTPAHIIEACHQAMKDGFTKYSVGLGLPDLREAVAAKLKADNGIESKPDEIVITPGAKNALFLSLASLLEPGDEAVLLTPGYVSNRPIALVAEPACRLVEVPLKAPEFALDHAAVAAAVGPATKALVVAFPGNPTGRMLRPEDIRFLEGLMERHPKLHIVSDEIYEKLALGEAPMLSPRGPRVITVNGFSKAYAMTGFRVGYARAAKPLADRIFRIHAQLNTHVAPFIQKAALAALTGPQDHLPKLLDRLRACRAACADVLARYPKLKGVPPEGGMFAFLDVGEPSDAFCSALVEKHGVAVLPGASFGPRYDSWVRVTLSGKPETFAAALETLAKEVR